MLLSLRLADVTSVLRAFRHSGKIRHHSQQRFIDRSLPPVSLQMSTNSFITSSSSSSSTINSGISSNGRSSSSTDVTKVLDKDSKGKSHIQMGRKIIVLAGATSVGKSAVADQLCRQLEAEIVLADSVQVSGVGYSDICVYICMY